MISTYRRLKAFLGKCRTFLVRRSVNQENRFRSIENFHLFVSEVVNSTIEQMEEANNRLLTLEKSVSELKQFSHFSEEKLLLQNTLEQYPAINYFEFENTFRGDEALIKARQSVYLQYFKDRHAVLDIGCGRGEFLELMRENSIEAQGIDLDKDMCDYCQKKGLKVSCEDLFVFLLRSPDNSFDGIFSAQVIEHLDFEQLQRLMYLLQKKLMVGAKAVLETVNPLCPVAHQHFYMDLTHIKPLFPDVVAFLAQSFFLKKHALLFRTPVIPDLPEVQNDISQAHLYGDYALVLEK
ncbi:MAG: methyltransferase domain-containing protein [Candidatus Abawacabacteria bacterium]|nr:methyltransferase domain-containing protein [Candidatus Abawacabacteria bacterium]